MTGARTFVKNKARIPRFSHHMAAALRLLLPLMLLAPVAAYAQTAAGTATDAPASDRTELMRELLRLREDLARNLARIGQQVDEIDARIAALEGKEKAPDTPAPGIARTTAPQTNAINAGTREEGGEQAPEAPGSGVVGAATRQANAISPGTREEDREQPLDEPSSSVIRAAQQGNGPDTRTAAKTESPTYDGSVLAPRRPGEAEARSAASEGTQPPYQPGPGIILARGPMGEASLGLRGYVRYLNGLPLDQVYTDSFGRTFRVDRRQDFQLNRLQILTRGWLFDPKLRWSFYAWTQNVSLGDESQVVVGGNMTYAFSDALNVQVGIFSLPSTRSTNQSFPNWLRIDHRTMADEYFRGSYSQGILAFGKLSDTVAYSAALTNNLSTLAVSADELDNLLNTYSLALWWMPTTGEYGPGAGFGDFEYHKDLATLLGVRFTQSREDAQGQPAVNDFENAQIRLSDGTLLFSPDPFDTGGAIARASYAMLDLDAGMKYRGWSLDAEYFIRWLTDFKLARGTIPVSNLYDHGFQAQLSTMLHRDELQAYVSGSQIFGEYGDPWDVGYGLTYFPFDRKEVRLNAQALYMNRSAVGYTAIPYSVGGTGWVWTVDFGYWF